MPYRSVEFRAGECDHLYKRGNNYSDIFVERENDVYFLHQLRKYLIEVAGIVAYCLMPDHYHLLIHLNGDDLSRPMQGLALSYTKAINKRYGRVGALFQGRFKAIHVDRDEYLLHLSRYIHLNPVMAGRVQRADAWELSSYREYIGVRSGTLPKPDIVLSQFPSPDAYRLFVETYVDRDRELIAHLTFD
jgi:putative transposase